MTMIDKEMLLQRINTQFWSEIENIIISAPSIDIVRCGECCGYNTDGYRDGCGFCFYHQSVVKADDYCSYGEQKGE